MQSCNGVDPKVHERPLLLYSIGAVLFGAQLMSIGFLAELIIAYQGRDTETYSISERDRRRRNSRRPIRNADRIADRQRPPTVAATPPQSNAPPQSVDERSAPAPPHARLMFLTADPAEDCRAAAPAPRRLRAADRAVDRRDDRPDLRRQLGRPDRPGKRSGCPRRRPADGRRQRPPATRPSTAEMEQWQKEARAKLALQRPFLSANDRSRWDTIRSLVEHGTYAIDDIVAEPNWDTIDMVQHVGRDGKLHLYSSKPPLLATLLAGEYWLIYHITGASLGEHPYEIGRFMLITINVDPAVDFLSACSRGCWSGGGAAIGGGSTSCRPRRWERF